MALDLFGGAMRTTLPSGWLDASDARPVPDHQEVWLEPGGGADRSVIIEILERVDAADDACAAYHFDDVAGSNGAAKATVRSVVQLTLDQLHPSLHARASAAACSVLDGLQVLPLSCAEARGNAEAEAAAAAEQIPASVLQLRMAVLRLPAESTDLLVTVNRQRATARTEAAEAAEAQAQQADLELLESVVRSLEVRDWGLLG